MLLAYYFSNLARSGHKAVLDNGFNLNPVFGSAVFCSLLSYSRQTAGSILTTARTKLIFKASRMTISRSKPTAW
jgi:hypothetical protein